MKSPCVLHIDIDAFFAAVEIKNNPRLRGKPVIIGGRSRERGVVTTASYEAREFGIHSGMPIKKASSLCPQGIFIRGSHELYRQISAEFFSVLKTFSPDVYGVSIDEAFIDLRGLKFLFTSVYAMAEEIKKKVEQKIGISVSVGLGYSKLGAKLATEAAKPGGIFFITNEKEFIASLQLKKIPGIGKSLLPTLKAMGITRVWELEKQKPDMWRKFIGYSLETLFSGFKTRRVEERSYSHETTFSRDTSDRDEILSHLSCLADKLSLHLADNLLYAGRVELKLRFSDFSTYTRGTLLIYPTYSYKNIWQIAVLLFEDLIKKKQLGCRLVGIKVDKITRQRDILPFVSLNSEKMSSGIKNIKNKFGSSSIQTGRKILLKALNKDKK